MPGYLHNVAARVAGISPAIRPRLPSRFEPSDRNAEAQAPQVSLRQESEELLTPPGTAALNELRRPMASQPSELPPISPQRTPKSETPQHETKPFHVSPESRVSPQVPEVPMAAARRRVVVPKPEPVVAAGEANESHPPKPALKMTKATHSLGPNLAPKEPEHEAGVREEVPNRLGLRAHRAQNLVPTEAGIRPAEVTPPATADHREQTMFRESALEAYSLPPSARQTEMRTEAQRTPPGDVHIVIGKLTVQAVFPPQNPVTAPAPVQTGPKLTLEQYLRQREGRA
jgi:hypothetical protein